VTRLTVLREVLRNPRLRSLLLAWCGNNIADWASFVALSVYEYERLGAGAVGLLGAVRMGAAVLGIPVASALVDRHPRQRVLLGIHVTRAAALAVATMVLAADAGPWLVLVLAALSAFAGTPYRPAHYAIMPTLARSPQELVAANVGTSVFEGVATLIGPAIAAGLLAAGTPALTVGVSAGVSAVSALVTALVGREPHWRRVTRPPGWTPLTEAAGGFRLLAHEPQPRLIVGLIVAQALFRGLLNVFLVIVSLRLLHAGESGVGFLNSAFGVGALAGGLASMSLLSRRRLGDPFGLGVTLWGAPIALFAAWPKLGWGLACMGVVGAGNSVLDVAGFTLLQRTVADVVLGRVLAALEIVGSAAIGVGSLIAPPLVSAVGVRWALLSGLALPVLALLCRRSLRAVDDSTDVPQHELDLLGSIPIFQPLSPTTLEKLAARLRPVAVEAGGEIVREGERGDRFYVIEAGEVDVVHEGTFAATLGPGQYFGEIALLHDVPRVATCVARTDVDLFELDRDVFVSAVSGHEQTHAELEEVVAGRLDELERLS
jgi:predicted MFS family arabinose efflux permease